MKLDLWRLGPLGGGATLGFLSFVWVAQLGLRSPRPSPLPAQGDFAGPRRRLLCLIVVREENAGRLDAVRDSWAANCSHSLYFARQKLQVGTLLLKSTRLPMNPTGNTSFWNHFENFVVLRETPRSWAFLTRLLGETKSRVVLSDFDAVLLADDATFIIQENLWRMLEEKRRSEPVLLGKIAERGWRLFSHSVLDEGAPRLFSTAAFRRLLAALAVPALPRPPFWTEGAFQSCGRDGLFQLFPWDSEGGLSLCVASAGLVSRHDGRLYAGGPADLLPMGQDSWWTFGQKADCCSDDAVSFGGLAVKDLYLLHYTSYILRPYGINFMILNSSDKLAGE